MPVPASASATAASDCQFLPVPTRARALKTATATTGTKPRCRQEISSTSVRDGIPYLAGTQASGQTIIGDIGRDLTLTSLQDEDHYRSRQTQGSLGGSFTFGSMSGSASFSISKQKLDSDFNSVQAQTGLYAGSGGFDITVDSHTRLNGAVIGSTATADRNRLDTGTLGFGNLDNAADYKVESQSVGMSTGMNFQDQLKGTLLSQGASSLLGGGNSSGHAESTTYAAVSDGTITIRDQNRQQQDVATLSRDVEHAANGLSPIFDKEREQQRLAEAQVIGEIGGQLVQVVATDKLAEANRKAAADKDYANSQEYKDLQAMWGTGGTFQKAATAATAALQGLAGNNLNAALAGAAGPYLAGVVKDLTGDNREANILAHAVVGAALAQLKGGNAVAGAAGAGSAPLIAEYLQQTLYPDAHNLTEERKQSISALTTVASGLLGGLAGGDSASVLTGMQAGKNEVENNFLVVPAPPPPIPALQPPVVNTGMDGKPNLGEQISQEIKRSLSGLGQAITNPEEFAQWVREGFGVAKPIDPNSYSKPLKAGDQLPGTPTTNPDEFTKIRGGARLSPDGSVWEKDKSSHGGEQWKRWPDKKS